MEQRVLKFRMWFNGKMIPAGMRVANAPHADVVITMEHIVEQAKAISAPVMQFTGLKDKNGKEIYEGDVGRYLATGALFQMVWHRSAWSWERVAGAYSYPIPHNTADEFEIIGNIYENPELLAKV